MTINYFGGCDPETVGSRLENQFFKEPFHQNVEPAGEEFDAFNGPVQPQVQTPQNPPQQTQQAQQQQAPANPQNANPNPQQGGYQQGQQVQQGGNGPVPF